MKKIFTILLSALNFALFSQAPQLINYQGVARTSTGDPIVNTNIALRFELVSGSPSGTVIFTEIQSVSTGSLGVFSTQIGKVNTVDFKAITWKSGDLFLRVSIDPANGSNFTVAGSQQLVSVPFSMHTQSIPTSYTNNVLSIGTDSYALSSYTAGAGISITNGSVITNVQPDQTVTIVPGNSNVAVSGTYPNFSVSATPSLSLLSANTLSISEGNSVTIAPSLSFTNSVLTVGPPTNTISLPASPNTSVVGSGAVNVTTLGTNSYSLDVAPVALTPSTNVSVSGSYPNFTIASTPSLSLISANSLSISGGNSVAIAPSLGLTGNTLSVGPPSNSIVIPSPTVQGTGAAVVTPTTGLNFVVNVPSTTLNASGGGITISSLGSNTFNLVVPSPTLNNGTNVSVTGSHPNFVINATPSLALSGNTLSISGGTAVVLNSYTVGSGLTMTGGPNYTLSSSAATPSITGAGIASVSPASGSSFTVSVPDPSVSVTGNTISVAQGTAVSSATIAPPTLSTLGANNSSLTAGGNTIALNTYTVNGAGLNMTGGPNYTITSTSISPTIEGTGVASVTPLSGTSFTVNVPATNLVSSTGVATVIATGTNSFDINVPAPAYNQSSGVLTTGSASSNITPTLSFGGNVLTVGPASNTVIIPGSTVSLQTTGIASVSPASGNNFTIDVPSPSVSVVGNTINIAQGAAVSSATIAPPALLTLGPNNNSLTAGGNTVTLNTYTVSGTGLTMTGGPDYTITSSSASPSITGTGAASVTPLSGAAFTVNVPVGALTATSGIANITSAGTNSFNIDVPSPAYNQATGALTTGTAVAVITPTLSMSGNTLTVGPASNTITLPVSSLTLQGTNAAVVSGSGNSYTVDVTAPIIVGNGATSVLGAYPNFTVATPIPQATVTGSGAAAVTPSTGLSFQVDVPQSMITATGGIASVNSAGTNSFDINVPAPAYNAATGALTTGTAVANITPTLSVSGNTLTVGPATNTITLPVSGVSLQGIDAAVVTGSGGNFSVTVASPTIVGNGATAVLGTYPNFTVATPIPQATVTGSGAAAVTPSTGLSFQVDVPQSMITATGGIASVNATGTNSFDINVPAPAYNAATGALTTGTAVANITPTLSVSGNTLTVGPATNTITLPVASVSLQGIDAAVVTGSGGNFSVTVASPTIVGNGATAVLGTYPNFTVATPIPQATVTGSGAAAVTPSTGLSFQVDVPQSMITATGGIASVNSAGTNSFDINVPAPAYNAVTGDLTTGSAVANITPTLSVSGNTLTVGPATNTIELPAASVSLQGVDAAIVTGSGSDFTVAVTTPSITGDGATTVLGTYPHFTVSTPVSQQATITGSGAAAVTPNTGFFFQVDVPEGMITANSGIANISSAGTNSFDINVPAPLYNTATGDLITGSAITPITPALTYLNDVLTSGPLSNSVMIAQTPPPSISGIGAANVLFSGNSFTVDVPVTNLSATGASSITGVFPNLTVETASTEITGQGAVTVSGTFPSYTISADSPSITGTGLAVVTPTTGNNFVVDVPALSYTPSTGDLGSGTNVVSILPQLTFSNNILTSGPSTNSVDISGISAWTQAASTVTLTTNSNSVGIGTSSPNSKMDIQAAFAGSNGQTLYSEMNSSYSSSGGGVFAGNFQNNYNGTAGPQVLAGLHGRLVLSGANTSQFPSAGWFNGATSGGGNHTNLMGVFGSVETVAGSVTNAYGGYFDHLGSSGIANGYGVYTGNISGVNRWSFYASDAGAKSFFAGKVGVGNASPAENLQVESTTGGAQLSIISPSPQISTLSFGASYDHFLGQIKYGNGSGKMIFSTNATDRVVIDGSGNVGINTTAPQAELHVNGNTAATSIKISSTASSNGILLQSNGSSANLINYENTSMYFGTNGSNRLTIMNNGNVGVGLGVLFPQSQLGVYGNAAIGSSYASSFVPPANGLIVEGKVGFGTPSPAQQVEISSTNNTQLSLISTSGLSSNVSFGHTGNHFMGNIHYDLGTNVMNFWTNNTPNRMVITTLGRVGINNAAPTATLDVAGTVKITNGTEAAGKVLTSDASGNATWNQVLPAGMVMAYAGGAVPAGWLLCDGSQVNRTTFATLFAAIGTAWGVGDGSSTFNLPDMRGMFLRGVASGSSNDPDRGGRTPTNGGNAGDNVGSLQNDQIKNHTHPISNFAANSTALLGIGLGTALYGNPGATGSTNNNVSGGNETRPVNVYVQYIIKQ